MTWQSFGYLAMSAFVFFSGIGLGLLLRTPKPRA